MKLFVFILTLFCAVVAKADQKSDDIGRITMHVYVPETEDIHSDSRKLLETKLLQIITAYGIADNEEYVRFVLTAKVNVVTKDIVAGPPQRISQKLDITLLLGDIEEDKVYAQTTISTIGIGQSIEKSYISAFNNIKPQNAAVRAFMQEGKEKVLAYYRMHCVDIMAESRRLSTQQCYEDALFLLSSVPDVCTECYDEVYQLSSIIYNEMIEVRGKECLKEARLAWANNHTKDGAQQALQFLSQININASCQSEASTLVTEIIQKMDEIDRREWEYQMQVYRDEKEREKKRWAQLVREHNDRVQTQRMYIKACRDVAVTYAKNQPKVINYNRVIYW